MLSWIQLRNKLFDALLDAFNESSFEHMIRTRCNHKLSHFVSTKESLPIQIDKTIECAENDKWIRLLVDGAVEENSTHRGLQAIVQEIREAHDLKGDSLFVQPRPLPKDNSSYQVSGIVIFLSIIILVIVAWEGLINRQELSALMIYSALISLFTFVLGLYVFWRNFDES